MEVKSSSVIYENPLPQLCSKHSFFPFLAELKDGTLVAAYAIGQAFESVDSSSYISFSYDKGVTWTKPSRMFKEGEDAVTDYCKVTTLPDGRLIAFGYTFLRDNPELPIGNPENGGLLDDFVFYSVSDDGKSWSEMTKIECSWGPHIEASAPITVLKDGSFITPITGFPDWNAMMYGPLCGKALRSYDNGKSWNDDVICMDFGGDVTCYEQRMCQLDSGAIICIGWNENVKTGERMENHYTVSFDNGKTFSEPKSTGVMGQASSVCALGGERFLALHAVRRDTDKPGIYGYIVDFSEKTWNIVEEKLIWAPDYKITKDTNTAEIFSFLKFGQPGAILLSDGDVMMSHWFAKEGNYKTVATRIKL